jgi:predicted small lipoprotein YifL
VIRRAAAPLAVAAALAACGVKAPPLPPLPKAGQAPAKAAPQPVEEHEDDAATGPSSCDSGCGEPSTTTTTSTTTKKAP